MKKHDFEAFFKSIYKRLVINFFFVRDRGRSKTMIFKPTTTLDGEKCSLWTSNFWAKSNSPFDLYQRKSLKNREISLCPHNQQTGGELFFFGKNSQYNTKSKRVSNLSVKSIASHRNFLLPQEKNDTLFSTRCPGKYPFPQKKTARVTDNNILLLCGAKFFINLFKFIQ